MNYVYGIIVLAILGFLGYSYYRSKQNEQRLTEQQLRAWDKQQEFERAREDLNRALNEKKTTWEAKREEFNRKYPTNPKS